MTSTRPRRTLAATLLTLGLVAAPLAAPPGAATAATTALSVPAGIAGETVTATGGVPSVGRPRTVRLQRLDGGSWRTLRSALTTSTGRFSLTLTQSARTQRYRVATLPYRGRTAVTPQRSVAPLVQRVAFTTPSATAPGAAVTASAASTPARPGRPVALQRRDDGLWKEVARTTQDRTGRVTFSVRLTGSPTLRAVALPWRGAAAATSATRTVVVTPPQQAEAPSAVSRDGSGRLLDGTSAEARSDRAGRVVVLTTSASLPGVTGRTAQGVVVAKDLRTGALDLVSRTPAGTTPDAHSGRADVSADGRWVVYQSRATDVLPGDDNGTDDVFVHDRTTGTTTLVSGRGGAFVAGGGIDPRISPDGRWITFTTAAPDLLGERGRLPQVVRVERATGDLRLVSRAVTGAASHGQATDGVPLDDGSVVFSTTGSDLVEGDLNGARDVYLHQADGTIRPVSTGRAQGGWSPSPSPDGRTVAYLSLDDAGSTVAVVSTLDGADPVVTPSHSRPHLVAGGTALVIAVRDGAEVRVVTHDLSAGTSREVTRVGAGTDLASVAPDGSAAWLSGRVAAWDGADHALPGFRTYRLPLAPGRG